MIDFNLFRQFLATLGFMALRVDGHRVAQPLRGAVGALRLYNPA